MAGATGPRGVPPKRPDLKSRRLYSFSKASAYPSLEPLIAGRINVALIRAHWLEILRVAASIRTGAVTASLILRQLASYPRQNGLAAALREAGAARTHAIHTRLAGGCGTAASDQPGTQVKSRRFVTSGPSRARGGGRDGAARAGGAGGGTGR